MKSVLLLLMFLFIVVTVNGNETVESVDETAVEASEELKVEVIDSTDEEKSIIQEAIDKKFKEFEEATVKLINDKRPDFEEPQEDHTGFIAISAIKTLTPNDDNEFIDVMFKEDLFQRNRPIFKRNAWYAFSVFMEANLAINTGESDTTIVTISDSNDSTSIPDTANITNDSESFPVDIPHAFVLINPLSLRFDDEKNMFPLEVFTGLNMMVEDDGTAFGGHVGMMYTQGVLKSTYLVGGLSKSSDNNKIADRDYNWFIHFALHSEAIPFLRALRIKGSIYAPTSIIGDGGGKLYRKVTLEVPIGGIKSWKRKRKSFVHKKKLEADLKKLKDEKRIVDEKLEKLEAEKKTAEEEEKKKREEAERKAAADKLKELEDKLRIAEAKLKKQSDSNQ